jgi:hypothetical protein
MAFWLDVQDLGRCAHPILGAGIGRGADRADRVADLRRLLETCATFAEGPASR